MIVEALRGVGRPVSAYELIDQLRDQASLAPQTVYRALDRLIAERPGAPPGVAQRLRRCRHPSHEGTAVFAICNDCGTVTEFDEAAAIERLAAWARKAKFAVDQMTLELRGRCRLCTAQAPR